MKDELAAGPTPAAGAAERTRCGSADRRRDAIPPPPRDPRGDRERDRGPRMNEQIRISPIRVIGANGDQLGVIPTAQAMEIAREANLDLVEVAATERPPVCKI